MLSLHSKIWLSLEFLKQDVGSFKTRRNTCSCFLTKNIIDIIPPNQHVQKLFKLWKRACPKIFKFSKVIIVKSPKKSSSIFLLKPLFCPNLSTVKTLCRHGCDPFLQRSWHVLAFRLRKENIFAKVHVLQHSLGRTGSFCKVFLDPNSYPIRAAHASRCRRLIKRPEALIGLCDSTQVLALCQTRHWSSANPCLLYAEDIGFMTS